MDTSNFALWNQSRGHGTLSELNIFATEDHFADDNEISITSECLLGDVDSMDYTDATFPVTTDDDVVLPAPSFPNVSWHSRHAGAPATSQSIDTDTPSRMTYSPLNTPNCSPVASPNRRMMTSSTDQSCASSSARTNLENRDRLCKNKMAVKRSLLEHLNTCFNTECAHSKEFVAIVQPSNEMCLPLSGNIPRHHRRHLFSENELSLLELLYHLSRFASQSTIRSLSNIFNIQPRKIKIWFQNRRARERIHGTMPWTPDRQRTIFEVPYPRSDRLSTIPLIQTVNTGCMFSPVPFAPILSVVNPTQWPNINPTCWGYLAYPATGAYIIPNTQIVARACVTQISGSESGVSVGVGRPTRIDHTGREDKSNKQRPIRPNIM